MNQDLKWYARGKGVYLWQVAERLGITEYSLSRKLRHTLNDKEHAAFVSAVDAIVEERNTGC